MPNRLIPFPTPAGAEEHARAETERKQRLFAWADHVLEQLGLSALLLACATLADLRRVVFDPNAAEVALAIRDALHPASGRPDNCFAHIREGALKRILQKRFEEMKRQRETELRDGVTGAAQSASDWTDGLKLDDKGGIRPLLTNLILFLRHHPKWKGVVAFDEFNARVVVRKRLPWKEEAPDAPWTDHHESLTRVWFQGEDINATLGDIARAVQAAARHNPFHPVRDYFNALVWDNTPRLDTFLVTFFHADDTAYVRAVGPRFLISACARIFEPGCKVDHTPIFEGPQGKQKSEALRTLAVKDEWFTDRLSHVATKDAALEMAGVLLVEIAEMDAVTKATPSAMKAFLTRRYDRFRPPYGRHTIRLPRQSVFAGTINPVMGGYLKDPTGARRFWPVACHGMIDREGLEQVRDQLWAEAVHRYKAGAKWWLETPELEALATAEQAARFKSDVWKRPIEKWLRRRRDVSIGEVLQGAFGIAPRDQNHSAEIRVANILTDLGFTKQRPRSGSARQYRYYRDQTRTTQTGARAHE